MSLPQWFAWKTTEERSTVSRSSNTCLWMYRESVGEDRSILEVGVSIFDARQDAGRVPFSRARTLFGYAFIHSIYCFRWLRSSVHGNNFFLQREEVKAVGNTEWAVYCLESHNVNFSCVLYFGRRKPWC